MKKGLQPKPIYSAADANAIPLATLLERLSVKRRGKRYHCPFHDDKNPSASIYLKKNLFHCFTCAKSWSAIDLVVEILRLQVYDAITWIGQAFCLPIRSSQIRHINKGRHDYKMERVVIGKDAPLFEQFTQSVGYADLSPVAAKLGAWLLGNMQDSVVSITHRQLQAGTGIKHRGTITRAIQELRDIGLLEVQTHGRGKTDYRAIPLSGKFRAWQGKPPHTPLLPHHTSNMVQKVNHRDDTDLTVEKLYIVWVRHADYTLEGFGCAPCFDSIAGSPEEKTLRLALAEHGGVKMMDALTAYCKENGEPSWNVLNKAKDFIHRRNHYLEVKKDAQEVQAK
jgi:hypothetical protein